MVTLDQIIKKTVNKEELSKQEINFFIQETCIKNTNLDYMIGAWLAAVYINGLSINETISLTEAIINSGNTINFNNIKGIIVDKHSTGGVGDKVSIILLPIFSALGIKTAKISGRGLGHTGGTIDKLESIGCNLNLDNKKMIKLLKEQGFFISEQNNSIAPADKILYSIRDVTGLINNYSLLASSILSKKLCLTNTHIFLDVKYGTGAFLKTKKEAKKLIKIMLYICSYFNRKCSIILNNMNQPLGTTIGNAIEVLEAIDFLKNYKNASLDLQNLIRKIVIEVLVATNKSCSKIKANSMYDQIMQNTKPFDRFKSWALAQGANKKYFENSKFFDPKFSKKIKAIKDGFISFKSVAEISNISAELGGGRKEKNDLIDFHAGIKLLKKENDYIKKGEIIAILYSSKIINNDLIDIFNNNLIFSKKNNKRKEISKIFTN